MSKEEVRVAGLYYTVIDGSLRTKVNETHPNAVRREYETRDGAKAVKFERIVNSLTGFIEDIGIYDGDFGKTVNIKLDPNGEGKNPIIQLNTTTAYGEDFLKRLPNVDLTQEVTIRPYAFTDENSGKEVRGIAITQGEEKVQNFFFDPEKKEVCNGFPVPDEDTSNYSTEDWKIHFLKVRKFLIEYATTHIIPDAPEKIKMQNREQNTGGEYPDEDIKPEDIPF